MRKRLTVTKKEFTSEELAERRRATAERKRKWELSKGNYRKEWNARNREMKKKWREANKGSVKASKLRLRAKRAQVEVSWRATDTSERVRELSKIQEEAKNYGIRLHIDHIVPICGSISGTQLRVVCGLHVDYNLQLLPETKNLRKGCYGWANSWEYTEEDINELRIRSEALDG